MIDKHKITEYNKKSEEKKYDFQVGQTVKSSKLDGYWVILQITDGKYIIGHKGETTTANYEDLELSTDIIEGGII